MTLSPGYRGIRRYSNTLLPEINPCGRLMLSETFGLYCSKSAGSSTAGDSSSLMFPVPEIVTFNVTGSFVRVLFLSTVVLMANFPTAPLKSGGAPPGSGSTLIFTGSLLTSTTVLRPNGLLKNESNGSRERFDCTCTLAFSAIGLISSVPDCVGKSAMSLMVYTLYCFPFTTSTAGGRSFCLSTSSPQKPIKLEALSMLTSSRRTREYNLYTRLTCSPWITWDLLTLARRKRLSPICPLTSSGAAACCFGLGEPFTTSIGMGFE